MDFFAQWFSLPLTLLKVHEPKWLLWFANRSVSDPQSVVTHQADATYLRKLSRISINKFRADGRVCSRYRGTAFLSWRPPLTLLIAATQRTVARRFPTKLVHLTSTVIWRSFFLQKVSLCCFSPYITHSTVVDNNEGRLISDASSLIMHVSRIHSSYDICIVNIFCPKLSVIAKINE